MRDSAKAAHQISMEIENLIWHIAEEFVSVTDDFFDKLMAEDTEEEPLRVMTAGK